MKIKSGAGERLIINHFGKDKVENMITISLITSSGTMWHY